MFHRHDSFKKVAEQTLHTFSDYEAALKYSQKNAKDLMMGTYDVYGRGLYASFRLLPPGRRHLSTTLPPPYRRRHRRACSRNVCPPQHGRYSINLKGWIEHWGHQLTLIPAMWPAKHPKRFLKVIAETANAPTGIDWKAAAQHHVTYPAANSRAHPEPEEELPPEMVSAFNEKHYGPDVKHLCQMIKNHGAVRVVGIGELGNGLVRGSPNLKLIGELDSYGMVDASPFGAEEIEAHLYK